MADVGHWYDFEVTSQSDPYYYICRALRICISYPRGN
ncbi:hypothetical protein [Acinetobacter baumannii]